jgi:catechol 2,3-dioxygenase-like lactoylglutathione lyase family enzyme
MTHVPVLRVARPTDNLDALLPFYERGLGFKVLSRFAGHNGFDGVILGHESAPWHLEFTHALGHHAGRAPTRDHLLAIYVPDQDEWKAAVQRMRDAGFAPVPSFNPWWDQQGLTFEDPDGYRVVLQRAAWTK